jgi:hypothetical protein
MKTEKEERKGDMLVFFLRKKLFFILKKKKRMANDREQEEKEKWGVTVDLGSGAVDDPLRAHLELVARGCAAPLRDELTAALRAGRVPGSLLARLPRTDALAAAVSASLLRGAVAGLAWRTPRAGSARAQRPKNPEHEARLAAARAELESSEYARMIANLGPSATPLTRPGRLETWVTKHTQKKKRKKKKSRKKKRKKKKKNLTNSALIPFPHGLGFCLFICLFNILYYVIVFSFHSII